MTRLAATLPQSDAPAPARAPAKPWYLANVTYDLVFFILSPWLALGAALLLYRFVCGPIISQAHIVLVFFRSHANATVFRRHPWRFTLVPALLFLSLNLSFTMLILARVLAQFWDIYHSSLQTFGIGRLYDRQAGNDPKVGRALDIGLAHLIYIGPVLSGVNLIPTLAYFSDFHRVGWEGPASLAWRGLLYARTLRYAITIGGALYLAVYLAYFARLSRRGYRVAWPKIALYVSTAIVSVIAWGYFPNDVCLLTVNFFHAWQYFGIVWWAEGRSLQSKMRASKWATLLVVVGFSLGYGVFSRNLTGTSNITASIVLTCSLMHFWWDGFIWSVRKQHI
jgi:hypothetical protein